MSAWLIRLPALVLLLGFFTISTLDFWFELRRQPSVAAHVARWSRRYPVFAALLTLLAATLVGHFFWQP